jgi:hypothetical protein
LSQWNFYSDSDNGTTLSLPFGDQMYIGDNDMYFQGVVDDGGTTYGLGNMLHITYTRLD